MAKKSKKYEAAQQKAEAQFFEARKIAKTLSTGKFPGMRF